MKSDAARMTIGRWLRRLALAVLATSACQADSAAIKDYEQARRIFWSQLYPNGGETLYCGHKFGGGYHRGINIEHVFPMGWVTGALGCGRRKECRARSPEFNRIEADLHNLYPARRRINDARGSFRFGEVNGESRRFGDCDFEVSERQRTAEPRLEARGEIARAMFYMQQRYGLRIFPRLGRTLIQWHFADPPSEHEKYRNARIQKLQGNRNPYIDDPGLARKIRFER